MALDERNKEMFISFTDIVYNSKTLRKHYSNLEQVRKISWVLSKAWERRWQPSISQDLNNLDLEDLDGNLIAYEMELNARNNQEEPKTKKKDVALKAENDAEHEGAFGSLVKGLKSFLKTIHERSFFLNKSII